MTYIRETDLHSGSRFHQRLINSSNELKPVSLHYNMRDGKNIQGILITIISSFSFHMQISKAL